MKPNFGGSWEIPSQTLAAAGGSFSHYSIAFSAGESGESEGGSASRVSIT